VKYTYIGIDPSIQRLVVAAMRGDSIKVKTHDNTITAYQWWEPWLKEWRRVTELEVLTAQTLNKIPGSKIVAVEGISFASRNRVAMSGKVEHALLTGIKTCALVNKVYVIPPSTWKKMILGKGNASKEDVRHILFEKMENLSTGREYTEHELDAIGVMLAGRMMHEEGD